MKLNIATWNVLADCYIHGQVKNTLLVTTQSEGDVLAPNNSPEEANLVGGGGSMPLPMQWQHRFDSIKSSFRNIPADIYCLQEVDHYEDAYEPLFESLGYTSLYLQRPRKQDGCLIAFSAADYDLLDRLDIQCDDIAVDIESSNQRRRFLRQNVALAVKLRDRRCNKVFITATCHVHWNPQLQEVKIGQVLHILEKLIIFRSESDSSPMKASSTLASTSTAAGIPLILCGDFNTLPDDEIYEMMLKANNTHQLRQKLEAQNFRGAFYGPTTRFICDASLSKLCKWMRVLGVNVAMDSWENGSTNHYKYTTQAVSNDKCNGSNVVGKNISNKQRDAERKLSIDAYFKRAVEEQRVILTSSKLLRERAACPRSHLVNPGRLEAALVDIFYEFGLDLSKDRFLTVCGKCGGEVVEANHSDHRLHGKPLPNDRAVFVCVECTQPYWWNEQECSKPARAMKKAAELFAMISRGLERKKSSASGKVDSSDPVQKDTGADGESLKAAKEETDELSLDHLAMRFKIRDQIIQEKMQAMSLQETPSPSITTKVKVTDNSAAEDGSAGDVAASVAAEDKGPSLPLHSVYSQVHGSEPLITNWNGEFTGTLDYIFASPDWQIHDAGVIPQTAGEPASTFSRSGGLESLMVTRPQPSKEWPSDHFLLRAELSLRSANSSDVV